MTDRDDLERVLAAAYLAGAEDEMRRFNAALCWLIWFYMRKGASDAGRRPDPDRAHGAALDVQGLCLPGKHDGR